MIRKPKLLAKVKSGARLPASSFCKSSCLCVIIEGDGGRARKWLTGLAATPADLSLVSGPTW